MHLQIVTNVISLLHEVEYEWSTFLTVAENMKFLEVLKDVFLNKCEKFGLVHKSVFIPERLQA